MIAYTKKQHVVSGVRVDVLEAGEGDPLVYLHGAGAISGFDHLLSLANTRRLIVPIHPGFGSSDDDLRIDQVFDYVVHYAALFRQLGIDKNIDLIGHSLGGWIAALIAALAKIEVRKLVLACPAGLRVQGINTTDLFTIPAEQLLSYLVSDPKTLKKMSEVVPTNEMRVGRYREMTSLARIIWEKGYDPKLDRVLTHIRADTLILWGEQDRILPVELAKHWAKAIPQATVKTFQGAGHLPFAENEASLKAASDFVSA